ncbi:MAG: hypothetical protein WCK90_04120 [archaeon]
MAEIKPDRCTRVNIKEGANKEISVVLDQVKLILDYVYPRISVNIQKSLGDRPRSWRDNVDIVPPVAGKQGAVGSLEFNTIVGSEKFMYMGPWVYRDITQDILIVRAYSEIDMAHCYINRDFEAEVKGGLRSYEADPNHTFDIATTVTPFEIMRRRRCLGFEKKWYDGATR